MSTRKNLLDGLFFARLAGTSHAARLRAAMAVTMLDVFKSFASFADRLSDGSYMDNSHFAKLTRDCGRACHTPHAPLPWPW